MEAVLSLRMSEQVFITWLGTQKRHSLELTALCFNVLVPILQKFLFLNLGLVIENPVTIWKLIYRHITAH
jgi:hypothetical protein